MKKNEGITELSDLPKCSFCEKHRDEVRKLIAGPNAYICDECNDLCNDIIQSEWEEERKAYEGKISPQKIINHLDKHLVGQSNAKKTLSASLYKHVMNGVSNSSPLPKTNILLIGPTGVGKTSMVKTILPFFNVPFVMINASRFTRSGHFIFDPGEIMKSLLQNADFDSEKAERGVVFVDQIDKIKHLNNQETDLKLQESLINLLEGELVETDIKSSGNEKILIDTQNILFILSGIFPGLRQIIQKRLDQAGHSTRSKNKTNIISQTSILKRVKPKDLVTYGFMPEFIARFPVLVVFDPLSEKDLTDILRHSEDSLIRHYKDWFKQNYIELKITAGGLNAVAKKAQNLKMGA